MKATRYWGLSVVAAAAISLVPGAVGTATVSTLYVDGGNAACSDTGSGLVDQPFCTISAAATKVTAGQTVQVAPGNYLERVVVSNSGTSSAPIVFTAAPDAIVTVSGQTNGFYLSGRSWVTISGFQVSNTSDYGIALNNSSYITLANNHVSYSGQPAKDYTKYGIRLNNVTDSLVSRNITDHNTNAGIALVSGSTRNEVRDNQSFGNAMGYQRAAAGIHLYSAPANTVDGNIAHDNEDSGINIYPGSNDCVVFNNVTYNNGDHGIDDSFAPGATIVANTVYKNVTAGINVEGNATGAQVANNISVDNGLNSPRTHGDIRIESGSTDGTTMDHDLVSLTTTDTLLIWNSVSYTSLASFQAASGQEAHGIQADPRWSNRAGGDFHLLSGSPAIDSADSAAKDEPIVDVAGSARVDDPPTPNTGTGPRAYDDRGAYEFQPAPSGDAAPIAQLSATPNSGLAPLTVTADASASTDTDSTPIASYTFNPGDGSAAVGPQGTATASHTYSAPGTYTATVTVTDTAGLSSSATTSVQVKAQAVDAPPAAALTVTPSSGAINLSVTADGSASTDTDGTPIASYTFDFGDGSPSVGPHTAAKATHTYTTVGAYTVQMTATDSAGLRSTATVSVTVVDNAPSVNLKVTPTTGKAPLLVTASATASDTDATPVANFSFDFGDGSSAVGPQTAATATHTYTAAGTYTITVTVADTAGLRTAAQRQVKTHS